MVNALSHEVVLAKTIVSLKKDLMIHLQLIPSKLLNINRTKVDLKNGLNFPRGTTNPII